MRDLAQKTYTKLYYLNKNIHSKNTNNQLFKTDC